MEMTELKPSGPTSRESKLKFKIVILGGPKVGKSSILYKIVHKVFDLTVVTNVGVEFGCLEIAHKDKRYKVQLWDTEGQESISSIYEGFYKNAIGRDW